MNWRQIGYSNTNLVLLVMGEGFERYTGAGNGVEHEAGYDAYMTGVIYLAFIAFIHEKQEESPKKENTLKRKRDDLEEDKDDSDEDDEEKVDDEHKEEEKEEAKEEVKENGEPSSESSSESSSEEEGEASDSDEEESQSLFMHKSVTPYYGKIYLMRSDIPYINLKGEEEIGKVSI